ncbi:F0F1 ATP synthase subunit A [Mucilaginibacter sp. dw_454]|uniref:F0F1 ATP synthase subunit A n=1 Tax=Mucilaginibacter sp. dw_454 TaxID=2720079 RepID=UPI001BD656CC|nr:F0F1 ATP synthase subunit A [Mucilaginibacter sp. dw_454]
MYKSSILKSKIFRGLQIFCVFLTLTAFLSPAFGQDKPTQEVEKGVEKKFEPSEVILEHIADSHYFHLGGEASFPLPVILYTNKGLEVFSSSQLEHGHTDYAGKYYTYRLVNDKVNVVGPANSLTESASVFKGSPVVDLSITRNVVSMFMSIIVLLIIFIAVASAYKKREGKAPKGLQSFMEPIIIFVRDDIARPNIGYKYQRFMPLLLTVFFFIWINNLIGLVPFFPGGSNLTGNIAVTLVLSVITLLMVNLNGNKHYWKHIFIPADVPVWIWPLWWVIELVGIISRPFALMIRLFANITAGHIIVLSLISLIFVFKSLYIAPVSVAFVVFMDVLELLVAALQAFIFTLLTALFIGTAIEEAHH